MITIFQSVTSFFKFNRICVDNNVFRLHYKVTVGTLITFSIVVSAYQFFGNPISCLKTSIRQEAVETFCWAHSTFSLPESFDKEVGEEVPYPGVDKYVEGKERVFHQYYQWVCFMLLLQAVMFIVPHYLWKTWEGGTMKAIVLNLDVPILDHDAKDENKERLVDYLKSHLRLHASYITAYVICEILNLLNVIGQIFLINRFLGYAFTTYGIKVIEYTEMDDRKRPDVMTRVFPKMTKCLFHVFGSGGSVEKIDTLCILPLNVINEKIYVFLWFWLVLLCTVSAAVLVYRIVVLISPRARYYMLWMRCRNVDRVHLEKVLSRGHAGDWFVLSLLSKNLDGNHFSEVISAFSNELDSANNKNSLYIYHKADKKLGSFL